jgi:hypothetical protein
MRLGHQENRVAGPVSRRRSCSTARRAVAARRLQRRAGSRRLDATCVGASTPVILKRADARPLSFHRIIVVECWPPREGIPFAALRCPSLPFAALRCPSLPLSASGQESTPSERRRAGRRASGQEASSQNRCDPGLRHNWWRGVEPEPTSRAGRIQRMLMKRAISSAAIVSESTASAIISSLARGVNGAVSAGLSAVAKQNARKT